MRTVARFLETSPSSDGVLIPASRLANMAEERQISSLTAKVPVYRRGFGDAAAVSAGACIR